jgi:hypothetical protein
MSQLASSRRDESQQQLTSYLNPQTGAETGTRTQRVPLIRETDPDLWSAD